MFRVGAAERPRIELPDPPEGERASPPRSSSSSEGPGSSKATVRRHRSFGSPPGSARRAFEAGWRPRVAHVLRHGGRGGRWRRGWHTTFRGEEPRALLILPPDQVGTHLAQVQLPLAEIRRLRGYGLHRLDRAVHDIGSRPHLRTEGLELGRIRGLRPSPPRLRATHDLLRPNPHLVQGGVVGGRFCVRPPQALPECGDSPLNPGQLLFNGIQRILHPGVLGPVPAWIRSPAWRRPLGKRQSYSGRMLARGFGGPVPGVPA